MPTTKTRFTSLPQGVIFCVGLIKGLEGTTRYDVPDEMRKELEGIAQELTTLVKEFS